MNIEITEESIIAAAELVHVPIAFEVASVFDVSTSDAGLGGITLSERRLDIPYMKDYDTVGAENPTQWSERFDISNWGLNVARSNGELVGGAVVAFNTEDMCLLEGRRDFAILWDMRVLPEARGRGIWSALFRVVKSWAAARGV
jgi:GNAT superfamily N-acetyltransferase